jgi:D-glycero-D-manno-heptose 1,7-bisphosphate phosphatase
MLAMSALRGVLGRLQRDKAPAAQAAPPGFRAPASVPAEFSPPLAVLFALNISATVGIRDAADLAHECGAAVGVVGDHRVVTGHAPGSPQDGDVYERDRAGLIDRDVVDVWAVCPHDVIEQCTCRSPGPGLVTAVARRLGVPSSRCAVIGERGRDLESARRAGARGVLVPTGVTRSVEVRSAPVVAPDPVSAVALCFGYVPAPSVP